MQNDENYLNERLTTKEFAQHYKIPESTQRFMRWARKNNIPNANHGPKYQLAGRKVLYRRADIELWLQEQSI
jgi:hypothetical protein